MKANNLSDLYCPIIKDNCKENCLFRNHTDVDGITIDGCEFELSIIPYFNKTIGMFVRESKRDTERENLNEVH